MREIRPYGSEGGGGETLPTPIATGVSEDGNVVVGKSLSSNTSSVFIWTPFTGITNFGSGLLGYPSVSANGDVVLAVLNSKAIRWTPTFGNVDLGITNGRIAGISADGNTVVGYQYISSVTTTAYYWNTSDGLKTLAGLGGKYS